jgi:hypothetical protein
MLYADLVTEVYAITGRPDRVAETASAIKAATLEAHQQDYFYPDLVEILLDLGSADFDWSLDYNLISTKWRALKYLRKYDNTTSTPGKILDVIVPENVLDDYSVTKQDVCYIAGSFININSSTQERYYLLGFYNNPDINIATYSSWVAVRHPYAIVYSACAKVFKAIGKDEEAATYKSMVPEQYALIKVSNILAIGY